MSVGILCMALTAFSIPYFTVIPLGTSGGELDENLSSYLVAPINSNEFVALDAGTLCSAIRKIPKETLEKFVPTHSENIQEFFFKQNIKSYLISHAHLDHIAGLVICSTIDNKKTILGTQETLDNLQNYIFNWKIWPNFTDTGIKPRLNQYHYQVVSLKNEVQVPNTAIRVRIFPLSHGEHYPSTAFLLESKNHYLLYLGDTGADAIEHSNDLSEIWKTIAPLIKQKQLAAIFIESSYLNNRPNQQLFGHLNPHWLLAELHKLAITVDSKRSSKALTGLKIIVTHIKMGFDSGNLKTLEQLNKDNDLGVEFIIPEPQVLMKV